MNETKFVQKQNFKNIFFYEQTVAYNFFFRTIECKTPMNAIAKN